MTTTADIASDPFYERDLEQMARAGRYLAWQFGLVRPFVSGHVLEVGAGIGNFTSRFAGVASQVTALEPNRYCFGRLVDATRHLPRVTCHEMTVEDFHRGPARGREFDTIVCMNVLEHLADDGAVLREFRALASGGSHLVLLVPAVPAAFGEIDRRLGHYRRYSAASARDLLTTCGWLVHRLRYFNTVGLLGWLWNTKVAPRVEQSDGQIAFFDEWIVPWLSRLESVVPPPLGQCLLVVGVPGVPDGAAHR